MSATFYAFFPQGKESGGPEALHQLVDSFRRQGLNAYLVPYPETRSKARVPTYAKYDCPIAVEVPDSTESHVIAPEGQLERLKSFKEANLYSWWLSIDNSTWFKAERRRINRSLDMDPDSLVHRAAGFMKAQAETWRRSREIKRPIIHLAQSEYARAFLYVRCNLHAHMLSDYTSSTSHVTGDRFIDRPSGPIKVAFNAAKGARPTRLIEKHIGPGWQFQALGGMTREQVMLSLRNTDIYLDLGSHPGKDRLPREAAANGAIVVVASRGAGAFHADTPLPALHKVTADHDLTESAVATLRLVAADLQEAARQQARYRKYVENERSVFDDEVKNLSNLHKA